jgi:hypothetical protein
MILTRPPPSPCIAQVQGIGAVEKRVVLADVVVAVKALPAVAAVHVQAAALAHAGALGEPRKGT